MKIENKSFTQLASELVASNYPPKGYSIKNFLDDLRNRGTIKGYEAVDENRKKFVVEFN